MFAFFIIASNIMMYSQKKNDSTSNSITPLVPIYEYGDSLTSCETNFVNLFRNWNNRYITNANQYDFGKYAFVETISDTARYRYYRNYFSGLDVVSSHWANSGSSSYEGKQLKSEQEYFIAPFKYKYVLLEQLPIGTMVKMLKLYETEINIDTIKIEAVSQESIQTREEIQYGDRSTSREVRRSIWAYSDTVIKKSIDSMTLHHVRFENLGLQSQEAILLTQALLMRVETQKVFNKAVHIGDWVYVVPFEFGGYNFNVFVICNPISKKVVIDYFFKSIRIDVKGFANKNSPILRLHK